MYERDAYNFILYQVKPRLEESDCALPLKPQLKRVRKPTPQGSESPLAPSANKSHAREALEQETL